MKAQMKFQKIVCCFAFAVSALAFLYSLGFMTGIYNLLYEFSNEKGKPKVDGANIFYDAQPLNDMLTKLTIIGILITLLLFVSMSNKRRRYYVFNYISAICVFVYNIGLSIWAVISISSLKSTYINGVDWTKIKYQIEEVYGYTSYTESTFWFDISYVVFGLIIVAAVAVLLNLFWKKSLMKQEDLLLANQSKAMEAENVQ